MAPLRMLINNWLVTDDSMGQTWVELGGRVLVARVVLDAVSHVALRLEEQNTETWRRGPLLSQNRSHTNKRHMKGSIASIYSS